jgi:O-antigen/teichoic acid export membrane protein
MMILARQRVAGPWRMALTLPGRLRHDSLLRNSMYIMATTVANSVLGYLYWLVAAHTYAAHDIGLAAALTSTMTLASILSTQGIGWTLIQLLPGRPAGRAWSLTLNAGLATGLLTSLCAAVSGVVAVPLLSPQLALVDHGTAYAITFVAGVALTTIGSLVDYVFMAERATDNMLVRNVILAAIKMPLLLLPLLLAQTGAFGIFGTWVLATAIGALAGMALVRRLGRSYRPAMRGTRGQVRTMLSSLAGNHVITVGGLAPTYLLPLFVTARLSATDTAYFYITWRLAGLSLMVSPAVAASLAAEGSHARRDLLHMARSSILLIAALLGPAMLLFLGGGRYLLASFGPGYARHGQLLLLLLVISAVPDAITNVYVAMLRVQQRLRRAALLNLGMAALTLGLAWVLLPQLGIAATGVAWLSAQGAGSVAVALHIMVVRRRRTIATRAGPSCGARARLQDRVSPVVSTTQCG